MQPVLLPICNSIEGKSVAFGEPASAVFKDLAGITGQAKQGDVILHVRVQFIDIGGILAVRPAGYLAGQKRCALGVLIPFDGGALKTGS